MLERDELWDAKEELPSWGCNHERSSYWIGWKYPPFYKHYKEKLCRCEKLHQKIRERCQLILDSGQFDLEYVELKFWLQGLIIDVPGDACCVYPDRDGYSSHNIDNQAQCFGLLFFFITALEEVYTIMGIWKENPEFGLTLPAGDYLYRLDRSRESKPFKPWEIRDDCRPLALILARDRREAEEKTERLSKTKKGYFNCMPLPLLDYHDKELSLLKEYRVIVKFKRGFPSVAYRVIATSSVHAEELVEEAFEQNPPLAEIKNIQTEKEVGFIEPMIISS